MENGNFINFIKYEAYPNLMLYFYQDIGFEKQHIKWLDGEIVKLTLPVPV